MAGKLFLKRYCVLCTVYCVLSTVYYVLCTVPASYCNHWAFRWQNWILVVKLQLSVFRFLDAVRMENEIDFILFNHFSSLILDSLKSLLTLQFKSNSSVRKILFWRKCYYNSPFNLLFLFSDIFQTYSFDDLSLLELLIW